MNKVSKIVIGIAGSRTFTNYVYFSSIMDSVMSKVEESGWDSVEFVSGGARGTDTLAELYAKEHNIPITIYKADWENLGKGAGFVRNQLIVDDSDYMIIFWNYSSRGTEDTIRKAKEKGITYIVLPTKE